jgi:hypothetical protein
MSLVSRVRKGVQPMNAPADRSKSLQELEGKDWGEPEFQSHLVRTIHRLRRKPLDQFTTEDLRIMIEQGIGLEFDFYAGDLLAAVTKTEKDVPRTLVGGRADDPEAGPRWHADIGPIRFKDGREDLPGAPAAGRPTSRWGGGPPWPLAGLV